MKKYILILAILLAGLTAKAADITLAWDANAAVEQVTSYKLYEKLPTGVDKLLGTSTLPTIKIIDVVPGEHSYYVTAVNLWSESGKSNSVSTPPIASSPKNPVITINIVVSLAK